MASKKKLKKQIKQLEETLEMLRGEVAYLRTLYWKDRELHHTFFKLGSCLTDSFAEYEFPIDDEGHIADAKVYSVTNLDNLIEEYAAHYPDES